MEALPRVDVHWDECDDPDFSERMPMRPTLTTRSGEWDDLSDTLGRDLAELAGWAPPPTRALADELRARLDRREYVQILARQISAELQRERDLAEAKAAHARAQRRARERQAYTRPNLEVAPDPEPAIKRARKKRRKARIRAEKAYSAVSRVPEAPKPVPIVRTCTCGHVATEHGKSGVCMGVEPGTRYICQCNELTIERNAS
jgi:hypothetical protein